MAQHCVLVSYLAPLGFELHGLLHDAAEAYFNDLSTPVKHAPGMETYRDQEKYVEKLIFWRFGLDPQECPDLKPADNNAYEMEVAALIEGKPNILEPLAPKDAEQRFLTRFTKLFQIRNNSNGQTPSLRLRN